MTSSPAKSDDDQVEAAAVIAADLARSSTVVLLNATAHVLTLDDERGGNSDGGSGEVRSEGEGDRMVTYLTQAKDEGDVFWAVTPYGRLVLALERRNPANLFPRIYR